MFNNKESLFGLVRIEMNSYFIYLKKMKKYQNKKLVLFDCNIYTVDSAYKVLLLRGLFAQCNKLLDQINVFGSYLLTAI